MSTAQGIFSFSFCHTVTKVTEFTMMEKDKAILYILTHEELTMLISIKYSFQLDIGW